MRPKTWIWALGLMFGLGATAASTAYADEVPVFSSGVDAAGNVLAPGAEDPHWNLVQVPSNLSRAAGPATVAVPAVPYVQNDPVGGPGSAWIGPGLHTQIVWPQGTYVYRSTFDLTGLDPATAELTMQFAVDNSVVEVVINDVLTGYSVSGFRALSEPVTFDSGFVAGVNTIELIVVNAGHDPHGLRIVAEGVASQPPPPVAKVQSVEVVLVRRCSRRSVFRRRRGPVIAAVLSSATLDATTLDLDSVRLAGAEIARRCRGRRVAFRYDINRDGLPDLVFLVWGWNLDLDPDATEASFSATTSEGANVLGSLSLTTDT